MSLPLPCARASAGMIDNRIRMIAVVRRALRIVVTSLELDR
jgi:hypothetical protein